MVWYFIEGCSVLLLILISSNDVALTVFKFEACLPIYTKCFEFSSLFSAVQMEESKTNIVHLDDVLIADMDQLLKFYQVRKDSRDFFTDLNAENVQSTILLAHRFDFTIALDVLSSRLLQIISVPSPAELQFADRLDLAELLTKWSVNCQSSQFYHTFVRGLGNFPLSTKTLDLFSDKQRDAVEILRQPRCIYIATCSCRFTQFM